MKTLGFNGFVGTATGVFKGLYLVEKKDPIVRNLDSLKLATNKNPVTSLNWAENSGDEIVIGYANQTIKVYNNKTKSFSLNDEKKCGAGQLIGVSKFSETLLTGVDSGIVKIWRDNEDITINTGNNLEKVRHNPTFPNTFASGGKENDLKIWDINAKETTFLAKNVRHDELELRVPVWITDIAFLENSNKIAVTTKHGHIRLYDPSSPARRPVVNAQVPEQALTCLSTCYKENHVIAGSGTGQMNLVDLRSKGLVMQKYKGFVGSIKSISCSMEEPYIASVSLDRHFRIHHLGTKELLLKEYMQSKLTCVLLNPHFDIRQKEATTSDEEIEDTPSIDIKEETDDDDEEEKIEEPINSPVIPVGSPVAEKRSRGGGPSKKKHKS